METAIRFIILIGVGVAIVALPSKSQWKRISNSAGSLNFKPGDIITTRSYWRTVFIPILIIYSGGVLIGALNW